MSSSENNLPWLILINPASGTKLAGKMFKSIVKPSLDEKRVHYEVMETEYAGMLSTTWRARRIIVVLIAKQKRTRLKPGE